METFGTKLVASLRERAVLAREEKTATALGDALHFERAAARIEMVESALRGIRRRAIFGPGLTTGDILDLTACVTAPAEPVIDGPAHDPTNPFAPRYIPGCPHAPTYDAGLCCGHPDDCTFVSPQKDEAHGR